MVERINVYSDFEALKPVIKRCWECHRSFTGPGPLCYECGKAKAKMEVPPPPPQVLPPTEKQLERINELKDLPEFQQHLDWLLAAIEKGMLNTRGQAGILINQMKKKCGKI